MSKATLVIMAAGLGSRYGGNKQIDPVDDRGHIIIDYSCYDAVRAGFDKIIFVIKPEMEADMERIIGSHVRKHAEVIYAYQNLDMIPEGYRIPEGRIKPWGTGHAVMCALKYINEPFCVINADDYLGRHAFSTVFDFITAGHGDHAHCMVGYMLVNTVSENGYVSRGVCTIDDNIHLQSVKEVVRIEKRRYGIFYVNKDKIALPMDPLTFVSLNLWGFGSGIKEYIINGFPDFLDRTLKENPLKGEYFLPDIVSSAIKAGNDTVTLLPTEDRWYGVTYREDKQSVVKALKGFRDEGFYPEILWGE